MPGLPATIAFHHRKLPPRCTVCAVHPMPPLQRHQRVRGLRPVRTSRTVSGSSHGVLQRPPLRRMSARVSTPGCPGPGAATLPARSALAVPPSFDGLLHTGLSRSIAPCKRPWGSPGFEPTTDTRSATKPTLLTGVMPFGAFPSYASVPASPRRPAPKCWSSCSPPVLPFSTLARSVA